jgi:hypothetical protein
MKNLILIAISLLSPLAFAHTTSESYLSFKIASTLSDAHKQRFSGSLALSLKDLYLKFNLDSDEDGAVTWGEFQEKVPLIVSYLTDRVLLTSGSKDCQIPWRSPSLTSRAGKPYAIFPFTTNCTKQNFNLHYNLFFEFNTEHRVLASYQIDDEQYTSLLSASNRSLEISKEGSKVKGAFSYVGQGLWHIWHGFDHILFILTLLLPAVFCFRSRSRVVNDDFKSISIETAKIITAFTISHSITLSLAVFEIVGLPSQLVEIVIAISVLVAALHNIYPIFSKS